MVLTEKATNVEPMPAKVSFCDALDAKKLYFWGMVFVGVIVCLWNIFSLFCVSLASVCPISI